MLPLQIKMAHLTSLFAAILIVDDGNFEKTVESNIYSESNKEPKFGIQYN